METKNLIYFLPGPIFMLIGLVLNIVSFSTPHWSKDDVSNVGLWKMCLGLSPNDENRLCFHFSGRSHLPCEYIYNIYNKYTHIQEFFLVVFLFKITYFTLVIYVIFAYITVYRQNKKKNQFNLQILRSYHQSEHYAKTKNEKVKRNLEIYQSYVIK